MWRWLFGASDNPSEEKNVHQADSSRLGDCRSKDQPLVKYIPMQLARLCYLKTNLGRRTEYIFSSPKINTALDAGESENRFIQEGTDSLVKKHLLKGRFAKKRRAMQEKIDQEHAPLQLMWTVKAQGKQNQTAQVAAKPTPGYFELDLNLDTRLYRGDFAIGRLFSHNARREWSLDNAGRDSDPESSQESLNTNSDSETEDKGNARNSRHDAAALRKFK